jgi:hypothetical protein
MAEYVLPLDVMARWEPETPHAVLVSSDGGVTALALRAHRDDPDQRCVVLLWQGSRSATMSEPGDAASSGHRLYDTGLRDVLWVGVVQRSELVQALEQSNRAHPQHDAAAYGRLVHHIVLLRERTVEVVAALLTVQRIAGSTSQAATTAVTT